MSKIQQTIDARLSDDLAQRKLIDVNQVAVAVQREFPSVSLQEVADLVTEKVLSARGNAAWEGVH